MNPLALFIASKGGISSQEIMLVGGCWLVVLVLSIFYKSITKGVGQLLYWVALIGSILIALGFTGPVFA